MKERPILFSGAMVRALLAGTKTQTRRAMRVQPDGEASVTVEHYNPTVIDRRGEEQPGPEIFGAWWHDGECSIACPYGKPGDRLWVRETWAADPIIDDSWASTSWFGCGRVVAEIPERFHHPRFCNYAADWLHGDILWTPSIHMPRWASRINLEVTGIRVERLQNISEADALAEGFPQEEVDQYLSMVEAMGQTEPRPARDLYRQLWESINSAGRPKLPANTRSARYQRVKDWLAKHPDTSSWNANPWVWVVEFRRLPCA